MRACLIIACAWVIAGAAVASQSPTDRERRWSAPTDADTVQSPFINTRETAAGGKKIFQERCSLCHGDDGSGNKRGPNLTSGSVQRQSDGAWRTNGCRLVQPAKTITT